jgi:acyl-CoA oxidase
MDPKADLARERKSATFPSRELAALMQGGEEQLKLRERIADAVRTEPVFSKKGKYFLERAELYRTTLEKYLALPRLVRKMGEKSPIAVGRIIRELIDEPGGLDLHLGMFIPTIQGQGDVEQRKYWLPMCARLQCVGTYAQTELGHGTYIRGLETTATYDAEKGACPMLGGFTISLLFLKHFTSITPWSSHTEEFIIHSPTLTSTKWWPGGMGKTATHAIVMARLLTKGKDHGPHAFVVQIRRSEDHQAMPGVVVGDIGPKMGYNAVDNGFLRFDHVRVARRAMLMKHSIVEIDGTYQPPSVAKASYGTMVYVRSDIVMSAALYMKKAVTIAMRYNLVRRQSNPGRKKSRQGNSTPELELQVIDYQHSQRTLFPILAKAFAFHCTSDYMRRMYFKYEKLSRATGDFSSLPELHATSSGLKAYCSWATKDAIELCRLSCGGQGFMAVAGFGTTFGNYAPNATYEGDNNVLCLQTARYLLKVTRASTKLSSSFRGSSCARGTLGAGSSEVAPTPAALGSARYLLEGSGGVELGSRLGRAVGLRDIGELLRAYAHASRRQVFELARRAGASKPDHAISVDMVAWIKAAKAHCEYVVLLNFADSVTDAKSRVSASTAVVLDRLVALHALATMEERMADFIEDGYLAAEQAAGVRAEVLSLLLELRPDAAALVDSFALDDYFLNSALGAYDGDVYQRLYDQVQDAPFNASHVPPGYAELLHGRLVKGADRSKL